MHILVADDDEICRDMLEHMLVRAGHQVTLAENGMEAWAAVQSGNFPLVISDWDMPGYSGPQLCRLIREEKCEQYIYVIMLTARNTKEELVEGLSSGADSFVSKPVTSSELLAHVQAAERVLSLETREVAIFALARLAESRDSDTGDHLERVRNYARSIAQELARNSDFQAEIDAEFIRLLYLTAPLHDIGKVGIPDAILLKPGRLTPEEFTIMQKHAMIGAETLDAALQKFPHVRFLQMARNIAAHHHERWDGAGYPDRLGGEDIPLCARIISVADVYDALVTRRVYKEAFSHEKAMRMIADGAGTQFDPRIVEAFLKIEPRIIAIRQKFQSPPQPTAILQVVLPALAGASE